MYAWCVLIFLSIIWGSSFILIKKALIVFDPDELGALRVFLAMLAFIPFLFIKWQSIDWSLLKYYLIVGVFGNGIPAYLFALAEKYISSSVAGVLNGLTPLFTLLLGVFIFGYKYKWIQYTGVAIGFIGAAILLLYGAEADTFKNVRYGLLVVLGTFCYGISVNTVNKYLNETSSLLISGLALFSVGPFAFIYLLTTDAFYKAFNHPEALLSVSAMLVLSLIGTALAIVIFFWLVQKTNALYASSVAFIIPIVALMWGYLDGEYLGVYHLAGMLMILAGVYLIRR